MSSDPETPSSTPWGPHRLPPGGDLRAIEVGPSVLWARSRAGEIWLAHQPGDWLRTEQPAREPAPGEEGWTRWPVQGPAEEVGLSPVFPARPIVVKPELTFRLLPRATARIFVSVPLWARVAVAGAEAEEQRLTELPTVTLSDTWWGEFTDGELSYWLSTTARREVRPAPFPSHLAVCPLDLSNRSDDELEVDRVALRVQHLSVYRGEAGFWGEVTRVRYRGAEEGSEVEVTGRAPREAGETTRVEEPRVPISRSFTARTFGRIRALSGMGAL